ncbi:hypothetical protein ACFQ07_29915 [Actinomadura adrarensis]|uniref:Pyrimidine nucleoside phosphorylase C-terminal domain-containing protein n=1 Tax=Actinomadura adrarensis TaxID=1819600 RepID=A0ABW3CQ19_9ACTN
MCHAKPGDKVTEGRPLLTLYADEPSRFARALEALDGAIDVQPDASGVDLQPLILDRIG